MSDETERLWRAFRTGFLESGETWNRKTYNNNPEAVERRLRARFEALHSVGKFDTRVGDRD